MLQLLNEVYNLRINNNLSRGYCNIFFARIDVTVLNLNISNILCNLLICKTPTFPFSLIEKCTYNMQIFYISLIFNLYITSDVCYLLRLLILPANELTFCFYLVSLFMQIFCKCGFFLN